MGFAANVSHPFRYDVVNQNACVPPSAFDLGCTARSKEGFANRMKSAPIQFAVLVTVYLNVGSADLCWR
jgi:hypothetical protein